MWASRTYQVFIVSKPIVNEGKRSANLLVEYPLPLLEKPLRPQIDNLKRRDWPHKNPTKLPRESKTNKKIYSKDVITEENSNKDEMAHTII